MSFGIRKTQRASDGDFVNAGDSLQWQLTSARPQKVLHDDPELAHREGQAGQDHKLSEIAPRHVMVLRPVDRKVLSPTWLRFNCPAIGRDGRVFPFTCHPVPEAPSSYIVSMMLSERVLPKPPSSIAPVTSMYSARKDFGNIIFTFVLIVCPPKRNSFV